MPERRFCLIAMAFGFVDARILRDLRGQHGGLDEFDPHPQQHAQKE